MSIFSVGVTLRTTTLSLDDLTRLAGVQPTRSHTKGERLSKRLPADRVRTDTYWSKKSDVNEDTWTLDPHWSRIAPVLETLASKDLSGVTVTLSIGMNSRAPGFSFGKVRRHREKRGSGDALPPPLSSEKS